MITLRKITEFACVACDLAYLIILYALVFLLIIVEVFGLYLCACMFHHWITQP